MTKKPHEIRYIYLQLESCIEIFLYLFLHTCIDMSNIMWKKIFFVLNIFF